MMHRKLSLGLLLALLLTVVIATTTAAEGRNFRAHLNGAAEVPSVSTGAQGQALFQLSEDGNRLNYKLIVANIENVTQAHIHCGPEGSNGLVVAFLYGFGPTVSPDGVLAEGTITDAEIIVRPDSEICPGGVASLADVLGQISSGNAYVNVHTNEHQGGEVRGQIH